MRKNIIVFIIVFVTVLTYYSFAETSGIDEISLTKSKDYEAMIPAKKIQRIKLPEGYHEGLLKEGEHIWVNNGRGGKTWVIDLDSEKIIAEIEPVATFAEGITYASGGGYWQTDWDTKKLYHVTLENNKLIAEREISLEPAYPAGVIWTGSHLFVVTWTRGVGTIYHLLKMDFDGNLLNKIRITHIQEPSQLAWDGKDLWISSWFQRRAYRIDINTWEITGYFRTKIEQTTGILWDDKHFWVTGTSEDLYKVEIYPSAK